MTTPTLLPPERLAEIKGRCDAATPGPWLYDPHRSNSWLDWYDVWVDWAGAHLANPFKKLCHVFASTDNHRERDKQAAADAKFIANSRTDIPALLDHITALTRERDAEREARFKTDAALRMKDDAVNTLMERLARKHGDRCEDLIS